jgi:eukaryotic-like serine/threonine-protein kinase
VASIGAYEVVHALKEGGMGEVLLARRRGPGGIERLVAIKTIRAELAGAASVRAMFLDEAGILARLTHPAVAAVHDFGEDGTTLYLVMEYVAGIPFRELMERRPPPTIAARAIAEACRGVHAAHELRDLAGHRLGVVHRDLSPENLMLGFDGHVKVIDFGIALVKNRQAPVTELGMIKGKPPYMSPEQVKNEPIDRQSDVFSLSVVLHELLTNRPLFDGDSIYAVARAVEHAELAPPSAVAGALPAGLDAAVMRGLERDRARRTPSAAALAEELEAVVMAAGGETLEAWAARELADATRAHRDWLAGVLVGAAPVVIGRPTGAVTALPEALVKTPAREPPSPPPAPDAAVAPAPAVRRSRVPLAAALSLAAVAAGVVVAMRACPGSRGDGPPDARALAVVLPDAAVAPDVAPDAPAIVAPPPSVDAALAFDARTGARTDARTRAQDPPPPRPDARPKPPPPPDAAARATAAGVAFLTCTAKPYANVSIDGKDYGPTPFFGKRVSAGKHHVVFTSAKTGGVVLDRWVDFAAGETVELSP